MSLPTHLFLFYNFNRNFFSGIQKSNQMGYNVTCSGLMGSFCVNFAVHNYAVCVVLPPYSWTQTLFVP